MSEKDITTPKAFYHAIVATTENSLIAMCGHTIARWKNEDQPTYVGTDTTKFQGRSLCPICAALQAIEKAEFDFSTFDASGLLAEADQILKSECATW